MDRGVSAAAQNRWNFEISYEVANKVGGIYTVMRTKAQETVDELGQQYCMLGVYNEAQARTEVELMEPEHPAVANVLHEMRAAGIKVYYGRWLIDGSPNVVLFDIGSAAWKLNQFRQELWEMANIGIPSYDKEANDACIFGNLVAWYITSFINKFRERPFVQSHFHEWQSGIGLALLRIHGINCSTIFTTHATLLCRYICATNTDFHNNLRNIDVDYEAGKLQIYHRYCMERAVAHLAHVFTTVSEITAIEAEHLLKRKPDVILPNGLNVKKLSTFHGFQYQHEVFKQKIHDFVHGHFHGHLDFNMDKTLYFFTAGRYEYRNKGVDLFIEALARLNYFMQACKSDKTVVAFMIFPTKTNSFNAATLQSQLVMKHFKETNSQIQSEIGQSMFQKCIRGEMPSAGGLLSQDIVARMRKALFAVKRQSLPPICTHNVLDDGGDDILCALRRCQLFNNKHDRVKVVYHPEFLNSTNPLLGLDYDQFVRGCHLGVFPSYYEPWGYTPAECAIVGIPSITSNLAGFGCFMKEKFPDPKSYGIDIIDRRNQDWSGSAQQLAQSMFDFTCQSKNQRLIQRNRTERLSDLLAWNSLGVYYRKARGMALARTFPEHFTEINYLQSLKKLLKCQHIAQ